MTGAGVGGGVDKRKRSPAYSQRNTNFEIKQLRGSWSGGGWGGVEELVLLVKVYWVLLENIYY